MADQLAWLAIVLGLGLVLLLIIELALRRLLRVLEATQTLTAEEREAAVQKTLVNVAERRHQLALEEAVLDQAVAEKRARLEADTALHETRRKAAGEVLEEAAEANRVILRARAQAEADLAPQAAQAALDPGIDENALRLAYEAYCNNCDEYDPVAWASWIGRYAD